MKFFKLGQKKTVYIAKDLTYHKSKKNIEVIGSRTFTYYPRGGDACSWGYKIPTFLQFVEQAKGPDWQGAFYSCLACSGSQGMGLYGHPNEAHGRFMPCPFCKGAGSVDMAQMAVSYQEFIPILQKQINDYEDREKRTQELLDRLTEDEISLLSDYFASCVYCG